LNIRNKMLSVGGPRRPGENPLARGKQRLLRTHTDKVHRTIGSFGIKFAQPVKSDTFKIIQPQNARLEGNSDVGGKSEI
jgi:hypothetical protein